MSRSLERVPDAIEPVIGYRMWSFVLDRWRASLFPLVHSYLAAASPWDGAHRDWVSASCNRFAPHPSHDISTGGPFDMRRPPVGFGPDLCVSCPRHDAPDEGCTCGFYATKTLAVFQQGAFTKDCILGRVELAGKVIEYTAGYRAERARILELIPIGGTEHAAIRLARRLRLPLDASVGFAAFSPRPARGPDAA
jgi:hypothetical protein